MAIRRDKQVMNLDEMSDVELLELRNTLAARRLVRRERDPIGDAGRRALVVEIEAMAPQPRTIRVPLVKPVERMARRGVGKFCRELLAQVVGKTDEGEPLGMGYLRMLEVVRRRFPDSAVDEKHLRWYASQMRRDGHVIPAWRERSRWQ